MVLTVSPNHEHVEEAVNTLGYANLATKILNMPKLKLQTTAAIATGTGGVEDYSEAGGGDFSSAGSKSALGHILRGRQNRAQAALDEQLRLVSGWL